MAIRKASKTASTRKKSSARKKSTAKRPAAARKTSSTRKKTAPRKKTAARKTASSGKKKTATRKKSTRKYSPAASESVRTEMHEMHQGKLKSGRSGRKVTNPKQAIAIGLSEARRSGKKAPPAPKRAGRKKKSR